jgi:UDP-2,3-diacylglucosamine hydrolase
VDAVLVSDVHCDGPGCERQSAFLRFLGSLPADRPPVLVLLGDLFHAWWHFGPPVEPVPFAAYAPVVAALRDFPLVALPGNHDFHLPAFLARAGARVPRAGGGGSDDPVARAPGAGLSLTLGDLRAFLSHGDEADDAMAYRGLHAVLRGRPFDLLVRGMGPSLAWPLLHRLAGGLQGLPNPTLLARQARLAQGRVAEGHALVAFGHTHAPSLEHRDGAMILNTGDWVRHQSYATVYGEAVHLQRYDG